MWLLPLAAVLLPACMLAIGGWRAWETSWREARSEISRTASAAAEYATRVLDGYVVATGRIDDLIRGLPDAEITAREQALHQALATMIPDLPQAAAAYVTDATGRPLLAASLYPVPRDRPTAADRDFFVALSGPTPPAVHLSRVYLSRFDSQPFFAVSRRRSGEGFRGVVNVSVDPQVISAALGRLMGAPEDRIALLRTDGEVLGRTGATTWPQASLPPDSPFHALVAGGGFSAVYEMPARPDGTTEGAARLVALRRLEGYPAYAAVSRSRADIVAAWRHTMLNHLWFGVPATLAMLALSLRVVHAQRQLIAANAGLQSNLAQTSARLVQAQEAGGVHSFAVAADGSIEGDDRLRALFGLPPGAVLDQGALLDAVATEDRARLATELQRLAARGGVLNEEIRVAPPDGRTRWLLLRGEAAPGARGLPRQLVGVAMDVTARKAAELALAESEERLRIAQDSGGIGSFEWDLDSGALRWSAKSFALFGFDPERPEPHHDAIEARRHPADHPRVAAAVALAETTGALDVEYRILRPLPDGGTDEVWIATRGRMLPGRRIMSGVHRDVTARRRAEEHAALLAREVEHRSMNLLTVVQATLRLTEAPSQEEYRRRVQERIAALARAHSLFTRRGTAGAELRALLQAELAGQLGGEEGRAPRVVLEGPAVTLPLAATQPLSMAMHELRTNATKYGALSVPGGEVRITWRRDNETLVLCWLERGGPTVPAPPERQGFGTQMIDQTIERQLGGTVRRRWDAEGLACEITLPLRPEADWPPAV